MGCWKNGDQWAAAMIGTGNLAKVCACSTDNVAMIMLLWKTQATWQRCVHVPLRMLLRPPPPNGVFRCMGVSPMCSTHTFAHSLPAVLWNRTKHRPKHCAARTLLYTLFQQCFETEQNNAWGVAISQHAHLCSPSSSSALKQTKTMLEALPSRSTHTFAHPLPAVL